MTDPQDRYQTSNLNTNTKERRSPSWLPLRPNNYEAHVGSTTAYRYTWDPTSDSRAECNCCIGQSRCVTTEEMIEWCVHEGNEGQGASMVDDGRSASSGRTMMTMAPNSLRLGTGKEGELEAIQVTDNGNKREKVVMVTTKREWCWGYALRVLFIEEKGND